jgi:RNA polymerase sigma-70 factor (ECF subfamily)
LKNQDQILFEKWQQGDDAAFDILFRKYYKPLCYVAGIKTGDVHQAEDIVQDLFTDILRSREKIRIKSGVDKYLYGVLFYKCRHFLKRRIKSTSLDEISFEFNDVSGIPSDKLEEIELEANIYDAISNLPEKCRQVFILSRFENKKNREIAEILHISIKTVETHMGNALRKLATIFSEYFKILIISIIQIVLKSF